MLRRPRDRLKGRLILVAEDEYLAADELAHALSDAGAAVLGPFPSVAEALAALDVTAALDGAVLDINLRGEVVFPLAERLEARGIRFVFATGYDADVLPPRFAHVPCLEKPVDLGILAEVLAGP